MIVTINRILTGDIQDVNTWGPQDIESAMTILRHALHESNDHIARRDIESRLDIVYKEWNKRTTPICSVCHKGAAVNTPMVDKDLNIYCDDCAKDAVGIMLYNINQRLTINGRFEQDMTRLVYVKNSIVLHADVSYKGIRGEYMVCKPVFTLRCWTNGGQRSWPVSKDERVLALKDVEAYLDLVANYVSCNVVKCTTCGELINKSEVAGYPLFAGVACKSCWAIHQAKLLTEKAAGHVCRMCGEPYGNCCC